METLEIKYPVEMSNFTPLNPVSQHQKWKSYMRHAYVGNASLVLGHNWFYTQNMTMKDRK